MSQEPTKFMRSKRISKWFGTFIWRLFISKIIINVLPCRSRTEKYLTSLPHGERLISKSFIFIFIPQKYLFRIVEMNFFSEIHRKYSNIHHAVCRSSKYFLSESLLCNFVMNAAFKDSIFLLSLLRKLLWNVVGCRKLSKNISKTLGASLPVVPICCVRYSTR